MLIGYALLTNSNKLEAIRKLTDVGCQKIYTDRSEAPKGVKPGLEEALKTLQEGDILAIERLDCLGTDLGKFAQLINLLIEKKAELKILEENLVISKNIDASLLSSVYILFNQQSCQSRNQARTQTIKEKNSKVGRPKALQEKDLKVGKTLLSNQEYTIEEICQKLGISRATLFRHFPNARSRSKKINI